MKITSWDQIGGWVIALLLTEAVAMFLVWYDKTSKTYDYVTTASAIVSTFGLVFAIRQIAELGRRADEISAAVDETRKHSLKSLSRVDVSRCKDLAQQTHQYVVHNQYQQGTLRLKDCWEATKHFSVSCKELTNEQSEQLEARIAEMASMIRGFDLLENQEASQEDKVHMKQAMTSLIEMLTTIQSSFRVE